MDHQERSITIMERLTTKPGDQFSAVFCLQDVVNRILVSYRGDAFRCREQEEIMITQHNANGVAETSYESEEGERTRATIDEVADEPQLIRPWVEGNVLEESPEWSEAALDVADCVSGH
jgi:hypothetical protein